MSGVLQQALALAANGIPVFPCRDTKAPATLHGYRDATSDPDKLTELFQRYPGPLIGVASGAKCGLDVLDLDLQHQAADQWWSENRVRIPPTRTHRTRSGGLHLLFQHAAGLGISAGKFARGVDVRADRGYCIWWPAVGLPVLCEGPIAKWPQWLLDLLTQRPPKKPTVQYNIENTLNDRSLAGLVRTVAQASQGTRNCALYWSARRVAERSGDREFAAEVLVAAAVRAGLPEIEARRTVRSALSAE